MRSSLAGRCRVQRCVIAMLYALRTTSRTMKARNLEYFLLLVLCQYSAVLGFGLLPSSYRNVPLPCGCSSRTRALDHDLRHDRGVMMMAFWEDIVPGRGQKGTTKSSEASVDSKCPVLICPAQLSVPGDYKKMIEEFEKRYVRERQLRNTRGTGTIFQQQQSNASNSKLCNMQVTHCSRVRLS